MADRDDPRPTQRFSNRVAHYVRARPKYPSALLDFLVCELELRPHHRIADIGSGTGFLTELFLRNGNQVIGIEPNDEMRAAGDELLRDYPNFRSMKATAEATTLPDHSADFAVAGQAFHWFDLARARAEFRRILAASGWVVLVWNERRMAADGFDLAYDELIRKFAIDQHVDHHTTITSNAESTLGKFFGPARFRVRQFDNHQDLTLDDMKARIMSSSYMPLPDHPSFAAMMSHAEESFKAHAVGGLVRIRYQTQAYYGRMS